MSALFRSHSTRYAWPLLFCVLTYVLHVRYILDSASYSTTDQLAVRFSSEQMITNRFHMISEPRTTCPPQRSTRPSWSTISSNLNGLMTFVCHQCWTYKKAGRICQQSWNTKVALQHYEYFHLPYKIISPQTQNNKYASIIQASRSI